MLSIIRSISTDTKFSGAPRARKLMRLCGQIVFFLYLALFVCDTINIDVLWASMKGNVTFVDDPSITDSLFDTGTTHHCSAFDAPVHANYHHSFTSKDHRRIKDDNLVKNVIAEDEDSPGIADAVLSSSFADQGELPRPESNESANDTIPYLDRTINYQRILI
jgi:hypothetical protein